MDGQEVVSAPVVPLEGAVWQELFGITFLAVAHGRSTTKVFVQAVFSDGEQQGNLHR
jgi:hypothetical protein